MKIEPIINDVILYLERRLPQLGRTVNINKRLNVEGKVAVNPELFQWAVENLVKNAIDAMKSSKEARIDIHSVEKEKHIIIDIIDTGGGIDSKHSKNIFRPGYSTKKRGWGLGLSLTKRIIENYHNGKVYIERSEVGKGTTMRILLPKA